MIVKYYCYRIKYKIILLCDSHEVIEYFVVLIKGLSIHCYMVVYVYNSWAAFCYLVYRHLLHVLGYVNAKWHPQEMLLAKMDTEGSQQLCLMVKVN